MKAAVAHTSALLALLNAGDEHHSRAARVFATLRRHQTPLLSTSFVLVETYALIGRRLGLGAVRDFRNDFAPLLDVIWVDAVLHNSGLDLLLDRQKRSLSLVDAVSFITMRRQDVSDAFAFDPHFEQEGFSLLN